MRIDPPHRAQFWRTFGGALDLLVREPGIGSKVELPRSGIVRRLYLGRIRYFVYYRVRRNTLEVVAFWHESRGSAPAV